MSGDELAGFASLVEKQLAAVGSRATGSWTLDPEQAVPALEELGVLDLASDSRDMEDSLVWLSTIVRTCAGFSPSIAYALAGRYAAQRAVPEAPGPGVAALAAAGEAESGWGATVPALFHPSGVLLLQRRPVAARVVAWDDLEETPGVERTGLQEADLRTLAERAPATSGRSLTKEQAETGIRELDVLTASVGLGLIERAVKTSEEYAADRRQFGRPISTFAGLAAILVEIRLRSAIVEGLLGAVLAGDADSAELVAVTGRACVDACLDAIQVHGGYGYIDEYPVAGMLRDAISLRARGGGRRSAVAAVASAHYPSVSQDE